MANSEPNIFVNRYQLAQLLKTIGKEEEAKKEFETIANSDPTVLKAWESDNRIIQYRAKQILKKKFNQ